MARRLSRRGAKIQPAVKTLNFEFDPESSNYVDLSQCASIVNRRFYRQGLNWAVAGFTFYTSSAQYGTIGVCKIPDTWVATNSWMKGYAHWREMNNEALEGAESIRPRFLDYKVFMDAGHHALGSPANLIPTTGDWGGPPPAVQGAYTVGVWDMSSYQIPRGAATPGASSDREIVWTGANYPGAGASGKDAVSLIEGYAASRGLPDILDPNAPTDAADATGTQPENWISALGSEGTDQDENVLEDMITENNQAPYPYETDGVHIDTMYPGGANQAPGVEIHSIATVSATTVGGKTTITGTNFQGGLIYVESALSGSASTCVMQIHLVPGPARGYMTQPMQDV